MKANIDFKKSCKDIKIIAGNNQRYVGKYLLEETFYKERPHGYSQQEFMKSSVSIGEWTIFEAGGGFGFITKANSEGEIEMDLVKYKKFL